jgi:hypothetical protein
VIEGVSKGLTGLDKLVRVCGFICPSACAQLNCTPLWLSLAPWSTLGLCTYTHAAVVVTPLSDRVYLGCV